MDTGKQEAEGLREPGNLRLVVLTAMIDPEKTVDLWASWRAQAVLDWDGFALVNGGDVERDRGFGDDGYTADLIQLTRGGSLVHRRGVMGPVPAFREVFVHGAFQDRMPDQNTIVAFLHDDVRIVERGWDAKVLEAFKDPTVGMVGFGGALGVGREGMYREPFDPMSLARHDFRSNMRDAESHGVRTTEVQRVAVLDGFSLIGRAPLMWSALMKLIARKVVHHAYDVAFGCETRRAGLKTLLLPIACHHHGGMSAVANPKYQEWAKANFVVPGERCDAVGDQAVWLHAHRQVWDEYRDVLPFRV